MGITCVSLCQFNIPLNRNRFRNRRACAAACAILFQPVPVNAQRNPFIAAHPVAGRRPVLGCPQAWHNGAQVPPERFRSAGMLPPFIRARSRRL
jgi:hypothetical protein